jgi:hypothetical protein
MGKKAEPRAGSDLPLLQGRAAPAARGHHDPERDLLFARRHFAYFTDTPTRIIRASALDRETGWPADDGRGLARPQRRTAEPGRIGGGRRGQRLERAMGRLPRRLLFARGHFLRAVAFPARHTSCPAFGGEGSDDALLHHGARASLARGDRGRAAERPDLRGGERGHGDSPNTGDPVKRGLGVCYYPEHWPEDVWAEDAARMAEAGIDWVRIGEFAWSRMEPEPGRFDWGWLDRAIDTLGAAGRRWSSARPRRRRRAGCWTSTPTCWRSMPRGARAASARAGTTTSAMTATARNAAGSRRLLGERYGRHPPCPRLADRQRIRLPRHDAVLFRRRPPRLPRLARAALPVAEALNRAWGNVFWSMEYATSTRSVCRT